MRTLHSDPLQLTREWNVHRNRVCYNQQCVQQWHPDLSLNAYAAMWPIDKGVKCTQEHGVFQSSMCPAIASWRISNVDSALRHIFKGCSQEQQWTEAYWPISKGALWPEGTDSSQVSTAIQFFCLWSKWLKVAVHCLLVYLYCACVRLCVCTRIMNWQKQSFNSWAGRPVAMWQGS